MTILLYGCEFWVISHDMESKINAFATSCYRIMFNIKRKDHSQTPWYIPWPTPNILSTHVRKRQLRFLGHILRLPEEEPASIYALYIPSHGNRRPGRPRTSNLTYIQRLLGYEEGSIQADQIATLAKDRSAWRSLVVAYSAAEGWWWWWWWWW